MKEITITLQDSGSLKTDITGFTFIETLGIAEFLREHAHTLKGQVTKGYEEKDLVSFGEYLLSEKREKLVIHNPKLVSQADLKNWEESQKNVEVPTPKD